EGGGEHGLQVVGERPGAAHRARGCASVAALVVGDDPVAGDQVADLRRPEGGRAGPAVGEHDRGGRFGSVHLDVQPGAVGGDGGQLAGGDGRGVRPGGDVGAAAHAITPVFSRVGRGRSEAARRTAYPARSTRRVSRRNSVVLPGQMVVLRPFASRYHLTPPPVFHTVRFIRFCTWWFQPRTALGRASRATRPPRTSSWRR